jgi:manganese transport protein
MGEFANPLWLKIVGYTVCTLIASLNLKLLWDTIGPMWFGVGVAIVAGFSCWVMFGYRERKPQVNDVTADI